MQVKSFIIPILCPESMEEEVNKFLRSHRVTTVDRQFCPDNGGYWSLLVSYQDGNGMEHQSGGHSNKVDYREILSPDEFERFALFKDIRKELAANNGIPAYAVFTDDELAKISQLKEMTLAAIAGIKGIGKRAEKYGQAFLNVKIVSEKEN